MQGVNVGDLATLFCNSTTLASWFHETKPINPSRFANTIFIQKARYRDTGEYTCVGQLLSGQAFVAKSFLFVGGNE